MKKSPERNLFLAGSKKYETQFMTSLRNTGRFYIPNDLEIENHVSEAFPKDDKTLKNKLIWSY